MQNNINNKTINNDKEKKITGRCYYLNLKNERNEDDEPGCPGDVYPSGLLLDLNKIYHVLQCCMTWKVKYITTNREMFSALCGNVKGTSYDLNAWDILEMCNEIQYLSKEDIEHPEFDEWYRLLCKVGASSEVLYGGRCPSTASPPQTPHQPGQLIEFESGWSISIPKD